MATVGTYGALDRRSEPTQPSSAPLVVVGVAGHRSLTAVDQAALAARPPGAQVGAVSVVTGSGFDCPLAGWATLGAGSNAAVDGSCSPQLIGQRVAGWSGLQFAQSAHKSDARLGTLAGSATICITAVGPGAAVAAARADGFVERPQTLQDFDSLHFTFSDRPGEKTSG